MLLYAADTWTLLSADVRTLDAFHQKCLRQPLGIRWYDRVRNDEVLQRTDLTSLSHLLSRRRTSLFGHVARLSTTHRQTLLFNSTLTYHSTDLLTTRGVSHLVVHRTSGSTIDATALAGYATAMMTMRNTLFHPILDQLSMGLHCVPLKRGHNSYPFKCNIYIFIHRSGRNKKHTRKHTTRKIEKKHKNTYLTNN